MAPGHGEDQRIQELPDVFLKFPLDGLGGTVLSATLRAVTSQSKAGEVDVRAVLADGWQEETLEGTNAPPVGPVLASATVSGSAGEELCWDVSEALARAVADGAGEIAFALVMLEGGKVHLWSKEARDESPPLLLVEERR